MNIAPAPTVPVGLSGWLKRHPLGEPDVSPATVQAARAVWADIRADHGMRRDGSAALLTPPDGNAKITKSVAAVYSLTLSPAMSSGLLNTCVRYADCAAVCVLTSGKGALSSVQTARDARTALLYRAPDAFATLLAHEITRAAHKARRDGYAWRVRLNAASDLPWEHGAPWLLELITREDGAAYDYTKAWKRETPDGYSLTLSADSRHDHRDIVAAVRAGRNVAVILPIPKGAPVPSEWHGVPAIDGDVTDDRTTDPRGVVVVLRAKGRLRGTTGHPMVKAYAG